MHGLKAGIGPEVFGTVLDHISSGKDSGKGFFFDTDPWIGLVVFQQDIVSGLELFYEVVFQKQGIGFCRNYNVPDRNNLADQDVGLAVIVQLVEIGRNALAQIFCFPHIQDLVFLVIILIHARSVGQCLDL
ncbi:hypothetical protein D3C86_1445540 [compost metagenome]